MVILAGVHLTVEFVVIQSRLQYKLKRVILVVLAGSASYGDGYIGE